MTETPGKELTPQLQAWLEAWKTCTQNVLSQVVRSTVRPKVAARACIWFRGALSRNAVPELARRRGRPFLPIGLEQASSAFLRRAEAGSPRVESGGALAPAAETDSQGRAGVRRRHHGGAKRQEMANTADPHQNGHRPIQCSFSRNTSRMPRREDGRPSVGNGTQFETLSQLVARHTLSAGLLAHRAE